jgi:alkanesulfonate monooxygenase SsuD/methylene tetrahydromethanopterin reductase-like flavin-dependent oxidoreductase (luciferase family)
VILLRRLWTEPLVTHVGVEESIADAGLNPLPPEPIPIWFGGDADVALRRMARLGDGWIPNWMPMERLQTTLATLRGYIADEERNPAQFGIDVRIHVTRTPEADWRREAEQLAAMGVTHLCINTMGAGYTRLDQHLDTVRCFKAALSA